jgi:subtilisin family serine protease
MKILVRQSIRFVMLLSFFLLLFTPIQAQVKFDAETLGILQELQSMATLGKQNMQSKLANNPSINLQEINGMDYLPCLGLKSTTYSERELHDLDLIIGSETKTTVSVLVPVSRIHEIEKISGLSYLKFANRIYPNLENLRTDTRVTSVHRGDNLDMGYTGSNVIIGIIDWGFDYTHPTFYDSLKLRYRILGAWNQSAVDGPTPMDFKYGVEHIGQEALLFAGHDANPEFGAQGSHGTHVAGIAAGGMIDLPFKGVAPEAELLFVTPREDEAGYIDAVKWMQDMAQKEGKRLVVNMSFGQYHAGTMDGKDVASQALTDFTNEGITFATSAGNNGFADMHLSRNFSGDTLKSGIYFHATSQGRFAGGPRMILWGTEGLPFEVGLTVLDSNDNILLDPSMFSSDDINQGFQKVHIIGNDTFRYSVIGESVHPLSKRPHIVIQPLVSTLKLQVGLFVTADTGQVHIWNVLEFDGNTSNYGGQFTGELSGWERGNTEYTVSDPGTTEAIITVAAHYPETPGTLVPILGSRWPFSSKGLVMGSNYIKPDVSAPGANIYSSINSFAEDNLASDPNISFKGRDYYFTQYSGTSMSSPAVAGVAALMLSANPLLTPAQVKEIIKSAARTDWRTGKIQPGGNSSWGTGKIDAEKAIELALTTIGEYEPKELVQRLYPNPVGDNLFYGLDEFDQVAEAQVYNYLGVALVKGNIGAEKALDISFLRCGIYYIEIKGIDHPIKFVKL